jgi:hypothetical protein
LATTNAPLTKQAQTLLALRDDSGPQARLDAMQRAPRPHAFGAPYIENSLDQEMTPQRLQPPVRLQQAHLNESRLEEPALAEYDAFVLRRTRP